MIDNELKKAQLILESNQGKMVASTSKINVRKQLDKLNKKLRKKEGDLLALK